MIIYLEYFYSTSEVSDGRYSGHRSYLKQFKTSHQFLGIRDSLALREKQSNLQTAYATLHLYFIVYIATKYSRTERNPARSFPVLNSRLKEFYRFISSPVILLK